MNAAEWIALASLAVSIIALLVAVGNGRAIPRASVSQETSFWYPERRYVMRVDNAGLGAMLDVKFSPGRLFEPCRVSRIESGGRWETELHMGDPTGQPWAPEPPEIQPLYEGLPATVMLSWRSTPFGFIRRRRTLTLRDLDRFLAERD